MRAILLGFALFTFMAAKHAPLLVNSIKLNNHKIIKGETAAQIARNNNISINELVKLNPKINLNKLSIGMIINVGSTSHIKTTNNINKTTNNINKTTNNINKTTNNINKTKNNIIDRNKEYTLSNEVLISNNSNKVSKTLDNSTIKTKENKTTFLINIKLPKVPITDISRLIHLEHVLPTNIEENEIVFIYENNEVDQYENEKDPLYLKYNGDKHNLDHDDEYDDLSGITNQPQQNSNFSNAQKSNLKLLWPVPTRTISSNWGPRIRTRLITVKVGKKRKRTKTIVQRFVNNHCGLDLSAPKGNKVFAAMDGQVVTSALKKCYGNVVVIDHGNGVVTLYAHCDRNLVMAGDFVYRGQTIAEVGATGNATGPHLHFELRLNGAAHNPLPFMSSTEEIQGSLMANNIFNKSRDKFRYSN